MENNLLVSYDLIAPDKNYEPVIAKIKSFGKWAKIHKSYWYVRTDKSASDAAAIIWAAMDKNDTLFVADATNKTAAWYNIDQVASEYIRTNWHPN
jgi:hypothetical protein